MKNHTSGPWEVLSGAVVKQTHGPNGNIAIIATADRSAGNGTVPTERDANIRLIAVAPEMFAILKEKIDYFKNHKMDGGLWARRAEKIISKAEGK